MSTRTFRQLGSAWVFALGLSTLAAFAQSGPSAPPADPGPAAGSPRMGEQRDHRQAWLGRRLEALKGRLSLEPAQESAWNRFTAAWQNPPAHSPSTMATHRQELMQLSTPERLDRMKALRAQHQAEMNALMDRRSEATRSFYAALTPQQQKVFDAETARLFEGRAAHAGEEHHRGGHGHHHGPEHRHPHAGRS